MFGASRYLRVGLLALSLASIAPSATASGGRDVSNCPVLPSGSGLVWEYKEGVDYDLCYAKNVDEGARPRLIGVYLGGAPNWEGDGPVLRKGQIEGRPVTWHVKTPQQSEYKAAAQTLYPIRKQIAHIWVCAIDASALTDLILVAEKLRFRR